MNNYSKYQDKKLPDNLTKSTYSIWLDNFIKEFSNNNLPILDLGCGNGDDTKWLVENKFNVVSSDFSLSSIEYVKKISLILQIICGDGKLLLVQKCNDYFRYNIYFCIALNSFNIPTTPLKCIYLIKKLDLDVLQHLTSHYIFDKIKKKVRRI